MMPELDDVPYEDAEWLAELPRHLRKSAVAVQDYFELQPPRLRKYTRSQMRAWIVAMRNRAWLVEHHAKLRLGLSLRPPSPLNRVFIDAGLNAPPLRLSKNCRKKEKI